MDTPFNFNIKNTLPLALHKQWSFPLFKYAGLISQLFLYLFTASLALGILSIFGLVREDTAVRVCAFLLLGCLVFFEIFLSVRLKITKAETPVPLARALANPKKYNLAEFLTLPVAGIIEKTIKKSNKKKTPGPSSGLLLYTLLLESKECQVLIFRLGLDVKKLQAELKNYLEKQQYDEEFNISISDDFKKAVLAAANAAAVWQGDHIGERELFLGLAAHDEFFKKVLSDHDLKLQDVENLTAWQGALEKKIAKNNEVWSRENLATLGSLGRDFASGFTVTLDAFSVDWRKVVSRDIFQEIVGHTKEVEEVEMALIESHDGNALIVGEHGVGRKSIVHALARRCWLGTGVAELKGKRVVELNMVALVSQIQGQEALEQTLDQILKEVLAAGNVILVVDQIDQFIGQQAPGIAQTNVSAMLGKYLAMPGFHFVGVTSFEDLHRHLEQNPSFLEMFKKIEVEEVSEFETIIILQNLVPALEKKHHILITYPAIREIINLTARYFPSTPFPKKAIDVLEESAVHLANLKDFSLGNRQLKLLAPTHVAKIISEKTKIPVGKMEFKEKSVLLDLENLIHQRIVNQEEAVKEIAIALRRSRSGLGSKKRPMGVFLFLGPTGVGKTETAKALAQIYFGQMAGHIDQKPQDQGAEKMIRLDMSEFQSVPDIVRLIGGVVPVEEQGLLTTPVRENPFSLVLLDEIEKAHPNILNLFLQVFDEGSITDGQGRKVVFTDTIIICTSNAGAELIFSQTEAGKTIEKDVILDTLFSQGVFKPEFVNRFDATVFFHPLTKDNLIDIAKLHLLGLQKNLKEKEIDFTITDTLKEKLVELSYRPEFGARQMRRVIQDKLESVIAEALLAGTITKGDVIEIHPDDFSIVKNQPVTPE